MHKLGLYRDDEVRQQFLARAEARDNTLRSRIGRWIMLGLTALACVTAVASFFIKGPNVDPKLSAAVLLAAPWWVLMVLDRKEAPRLVQLGAYMGAALLMLHWVGWFQ